MLLYSGAWWQHPAMQLSLEKLGQGDWGEQLLTNPWALQRAKVCMHTPPEQEPPQHVPLQLTFPEGQHMPFVSTYPRKQHKPLFAFAQTGVKNGPP